MAAVLSISAATPAFALSGSQVTENTEQRGVLNRVQQTVDDTVTTTTDDTKAVVNDVRDKVVTQKERVEQRKAELNAQLEQKSADRKQKLEGRRLAQCQNRQEKINKFIDQSETVSRKHLENVQRFEASITSFAEAKSIQSEGYVAMVADVDEKEVAAIAAIDVLAAHQFDCTMVDGVTPSSSIRQVREAKRTALHAYRDSVIQLIQTVKQEFAAAQPAEGTE
ncbi:MAG: hypothetical protein V4678_00200 [Patescibacteria group bacterium]